MKESTSQFKAIPARIEILNRMHVHCLRKMEECLESNDQIKFWSLLAVATEYYKP